MKYSKISEELMKREFFAKGGRVTVCPTVKAKGCSTFHKAIRLDRPKTLAWGRSDWIPYKTFKRTH